MTFSLHGKELQQLDSLITNLAAAEYARKKPRGKTRARRGNHALAAMVAKGQHPELSDADRRTHQEIVPRNGPELSDSEFLFRQERTSHQIPV